jgi:DNA-binding beta-propeller fold protein YncE
MGKKPAAVFSLIIILAFMVYMIYDAARGSGGTEKPAATTTGEYEADWIIEKTYSLPSGSLTSVAVAEDGMVFLGGDAFVSALDQNLDVLWSLETEGKITALAVTGDTVYASTTETIFLVSSSGKLITEWGPYEGNSIITSLSASPQHVVIADAGNKRVFVLDREGEVLKMMGQGDEKFIIPSAYFDAAVSGDLVFAANTGNRRIETWSIDGRKRTEFGEPGTSPGAFCGCCNPAHFALIPQGFITAEKGINRIKILDRDGIFIEFVSVNNDFNQSIPLDVASVDGETIYAANSFDNKLYVFKRK